MDILILMIKRIVRSTHDMSELIDAEVFPRFFELFTNKEAAREMSSIVLNGLINKHALTSFNDTTLAYQVLYNLFLKLNKHLKVIELCKCVHDVVTIHTSENAIIESTRLICRALDRFELKSVPEQGLSFFVAARAALLNLDGCQKVTKISKYYKKFMF